MSGLFSSGYNPFLVVTLFQQYDLILMQIKGLQKENCKWYYSCLPPLTISKDYFCAKSLQVKYLKFLHLNKSGEKTLHDFLISLPSHSSFKNYFSIQGRYMGYTKLNIHYIFTVPLLKHMMFFLLLIPERLQKGSSLGLAFIWKHG